MNSEITDPLSKCLGETAKIRWHELQRFFAQGKVIQVSTELDLPSVAAAMMEDDTTRVSKWKSNNRLAFVADAQARAWYEQDETVWAVVVSPFVLVQPIERANEDANDD